MNKRTLIPLILIAALALTGCNFRVVRGSGDVITEDRDVSGFDRVSLSFAGRMTITQGDEESLTIEAEDNVMELIETEVRNGKLSIGLERNYSVITTETVHYTLTVKDLTELAISGAADIEIGDLVTDSLEVKISGAGNIEFDSLETGSLEIDISGAGDIEVNDLTAETLRVDLSGAGSIEVSGTVTDQVVSMSGLGSYDGRDLESETCEVSLSGAGSATVWATESLEVDISGAGSVNYYGNPSVDSSISGLGDLDNKGDR